MTNEISTTTPRQNSSLAIVSLVCGILGVTLLPLLGSIIAVITAPMAKREIEASEGSLSGEEMAKIGQILGWIGIALSAFAICCCPIFFLTPLIAIFSNIFEGSFYYWLGPGLMGLLF